MESNVLEVARELMKKEPSLLHLKGKIMVAGDTHGDVIISEEIIKKFFDDNYDHLVFLGDYVDRAPPDVSSSIHNIDFLLRMKIKYPEKIYLLKGNHEANYAIPCYPNEFVYEAGEKYGEYVAVFKEMPLAAMLNNVFAAHGGFPTKKGVDEISKEDLMDIEEIMWSDAAISPVYRGVGVKFDKRMLDSFLKKCGAAAFIRGHDYNLNGMIIYERCLTIFSSRRYATAGNGGVLVAKIDGRIRDVEEITLEEFFNGKWIEYRARKI